MRTSGQPILINGLIYGALMLSVNLAPSALKFIGVKVSDASTSILVGSTVTIAVLLIELLLLFLSGRAASSRTGTVGAGALAGVVAAIIAGIAGAVITIAQTAADPGAIRDAANLVYPDGASIPSSDQDIVIVGVIGAVIGMLFLLGLGAGMGALGGLLGRQRFQPPTYQESMYQPPQPLVG